MKVERWKPTCPEDLEPTPGRLPNEWKDERIKIYYRPSLHDDMLIAWGRQGKSFINFCLQIGILPETYWAWRNKYPVFEEAVQTYKMYLRQYWEAVANDNIGNPEFSYACYRVASKLAGADPDGVRVQGISQAKSPLEKVKRLLERIEEGDITSRDAKYVADILSIAVDINERTVVAKDVEELKKLQGDLK